LDITVAKAKVSASIDRARGSVLLVRQLRIAACVNGDDPLLIELCAGMIDAGDAPAETVCKEAQQELGYRLRGITKVFDLYMSPSALAERLGVGGGQRPLRIYSTKCHNACANHRAARI
jgi:8-oxo-dGTP pyrophosphatase MutT (NUDIX family)